MLLNSIPQMNQPVFHIPEDLEINSVVAENHFSINQTIERYDAHPYIAKLITHITPFREGGYSEKKVYSLTVKNAENIREIMLRQRGAAEKTAFELLEKEKQFTRLILASYPTDH